MKPKKYFSLAKEGSNVDVMIYGDIVAYPWLDSDFTSYDLAQAIDGLSDIDTITVGINSYGGEVGQGLAIYNALKRSPAKVTTRCDGFACSAASIVFAAGDNRIMSDASLLMIHNAWAYAEGDANELRKQADNLEKITEPSIKAYMSILNISEQDLRALMDSETWISPDDALEMGFATQVLKEKTDKASQSARKKVYQMIINPYQAVEDEENKPDDTEDTTEDNETTDNDNSDTADTDTTDDSEGETDETDNPDENTDDEQGKQFAQFVTAIFK